MLNGDNTDENKQPNLGEDVASATDKEKAELGGAGAAPYIAEIIKQTTPDGAGRVAAHAVVNAALSLAQGKNALAGAATGEVVGMIATEMCGISPGTVTCKR
ncbi:hypothetical protein O4L35_004942 [Escherichia coli]|nr:hypothetical protein [Escherichia coli]